MMTRSEERALRRLIMHGGRLTLPGSAGPLYCTCTPSGDDNVIAQVRRERTSTHTISGQGRHVYSELAHWLDERVTAMPRPAEQAAALEVAHG